MISMDLSLARNRTIVGSRRRGRGSRTTQARYTRFLAAAFARLSDRPAQVGSTVTGLETAPRRVEALVIGSGQGGTPLARALARSGRSTALIEAAEVGGTCVNVGCTPTK